MKKIRRFYQDIRSREFDVKEQKAAVDTIQNFNVPQTFNSAPAALLNQKPDCEVCQDLKFPERLRGGQRPSPTLIQVREASENGCETCEIINKAIIRFDLVQTAIGGGLDRIPGKPLEYTDARGFKRTYVDTSNLLVDIKSYPPDVQKNLPPHLSLSLRGNKGWTTPAVLIFTTSTPSWSYTAIGKANHIGQHSTVVECEKKISVWIHDCARNHPKCAQKATTRLPGRVIDLRNGPSMISLLEPGEIKGKYITLSHCWGSGGTQLKTTKANLSQFQRRIPDEMLCKTYRDVIALSHALGITFLWIDSLCIVQDDPAEWDAESGNMAYIYENSYLTICATRSEDGNGGLFGDRYLDRKDVEGIEQAGPQFLGHLKDSRDSERQNGIFGRLEFEHHSGGKGGNEYSSTPGFERPVVEPLMLRAWAFQERLLSYRTVDFLSGEMVWECRESQRCECTQADRRDQASRTTEKKIFSDFKLSHTNDPGISEERSNEILLLDIWERIVTAYTELRLTFGSDKLPALSGLAQRIVSKIPETQGGLSSDLQPVYIAGLWRDCLPYQLLWYPVRRTTYSFMETIGERSSDFRAPSFSWASNNGVIKFHEIPRGAKSTLSVRIVDIEYSFRGSDPFGHCRSGKLIIRGPLVRGKIEHENENGSDPFLIFAPECVVANGKKLMWWPDELISDPKRKSFIPKGSEIFCLEILRTMPSTTYFRSGQSKLPAMIFGLVLEHTGGDGAFRRLGMCCERMEDGGIFSFGEEDTIHII